MTILSCLILLPIIELSYIDSAYINLDKLPEYSTQITVGAELIAWDTLYIKGGSVNYQQYAELDKWKPYLTDYKFEAGIRYNGIEAGYYHECRHKVISGATTPYYSGGMTKFFIRYGGKL